MIIGLSGKAQSGKDTVGDYLVRSYGFIRVASADALKNIVSRHLGWDGVKDDKGRKLLPEVGCSVRDYDQDFWITRTIWKIKELTIANIGSNFVITDVRFRNEARILKEQGAVVIRLERQGAIKSTHISETELDSYTEFDSIIDNNNTVECLYDRVDDIMKNLREGNL